MSYADSNTEVDSVVDGPQVQQSNNSQMDGVRDDWMTGTPLEGALLERLVFFLFIYFVIFI